MQTRTTRGACGGGREGGRAAGAGWRPRPTHRVLASPHPAPSHTSLSVLQLLWQLHQAAGVEPDPLLRAAAGGCRRGGHGAPLPALLPARRVCGVLGPDAAVWQVWAEAGNRRCLLPVWGALRQLAWRRRRRRAAPSPRPTLPLPLPPGPTRGSSRASTAACCCCAPALPWARTCFSCCRTSRACASRTAPPSRTSSSEPGVGAPGVAPRGTGCAACCAPQVAGP